ncbi:MAG: tetratricopeptide repeat protein [Phycisphaerae bacterium]|nr:tetratricopeptide repeat protein [Phycisphaerae bacterium]
MPRGPGLSTFAQTPRPQRARVVTALILGLVGVALTTGCAKTPDLGLGGPEPYIASYRAGEYDRAYTQAAAKAESESPPVKDRAALIAGLSAYAQRRPEQAEQWLNPLTIHADPEIAGRANWALGMIAYDRGNFVRAQTQAASAASLLKGDDAARARLLAGDACSRLGRRDDAIQHWQVGKAATQDGALRATLESRLVLARGDTPGGPPGTPSPQPPTPAPGGPFVVQLGAFSTRSAADQKAAEAAAVAARVGLPAPRIVATTDKTGRPLSAVRLGGFPDRTTAEAALRRLGLQGSVMRAGM